MICINVKHIVKIIQITIQEFRKAWDELILTIKEIIVEDYKRIIKTTRRKV